MSGPILWLYDHTAIVLVGACLAAACVLVVAFYGNGPDVRG